jgi:hypothetical protein
MGRKLTGEPIGHAGRQQSSAEFFFRAGAEHREIVEAHDNALAEALDDIFGPEGEED